MDIGEGFRVPGEVLGSQGYLVGHGGWRGVVAGRRVRVLVAHGARGHLVVALGGGAGLVRALGGGDGVGRELLRVVPGTGEGQGVTPGGSWGGFGGPRSSFLLSSHI